jgi:hypothetical protein
MRISSNCFLYALLQVLLIEYVPAQNIDISKAVDENTEWSEGTVWLTNGEKLSGLVKFNTKTGLLSFESGSISKSFTPRNVYSFEFFDAVQNKKRNFISVECEIDKPARSAKDRNAPTAKAPAFFEILMEFPSFALLSTVDQMQVKTGTSQGIPTYNQTTNTWQNNVIGSAATSYSQTETLLIFDADGNISPILDITNQETDRLFFDSKKTKAKSIDNKVLEKYTSTHFEKLESYAKENKLSFKRKDDLLKILMHYKELTSD